MLVVAEAGSAILLYACGNDVTGTDFSEDEWAEVGRIIKERNLFPIFNAAYLGLASGFVDKDAYAIRYFIDELKVETAVCASYDHSMGLYGKLVRSNTIEKWLIITRGRSWLFVGVHIIK